jgi:DNA primase
MTGQAAPGSQTTQGVAGDPAGRLQALHDRLRTAVQELTSADGWQQMLTTAAALPTYSPHNVLLITSQRPDARAVAGFHTWKQLGRSVRKGEKGIAILAPVLRRKNNEPEPTNRRQLEPASAGPGTASPAAPARTVTGFRVVHVFDLSQTDGPDLPEPPRAVRLDSAAPDGLLDGLSQQIQAQGFQLIRHDFDLPHPGLAGANGVTNYLSRTVLVRPDLSPAQTAKTLAHELGHVLLHAPGTRPPDLSREQAEVEAESVAYIVTAAHGLDSSTYTVPYVAGWSGADLTLVARTAERVLATAKEVLQHTPPPPNLTLPDTTRDRLRDMQPPATPERALAREPLSAGALPDRSRLITGTQLTRRPAPQPGPAGAERGVPGQTDQGRLW